MLELEGPWDPIWIIIGLRPLVVVVDFATIAELKTKDGSNSDKNNKDGRICPAFIHTRTTVLDLMVCWRPKE